MREMRVLDKIIITVATTGGFHGKEANPAVPIAPEEITQAAYDSWNEGAAIVHIHARGPDGKVTNDPDIFRDVNSRIRERCDLIIENTTAVGYLPSASNREKMRTMEANPEMATLNMGTLVSNWRGSQGVTIRSREDMEWGAQEMIRRGIKPEMEIYNPAMMVEVQNLIDKDLLRKPYYISFVLHMHRLCQGAIPYSPRALVHNIDLLPPDSMFSVVGVAESQLHLTTLAILLGGNLRVGLEDNVYYKRGVLAESNAQLVARAVRIARELGCEIASPEDARSMLGVPSVSK